MAIEQLKNASTETLADINALLGELRSERSDGVLEELEAILSRDDVAVFVAREEGRIAGIAFLYVIQKVGKRIGYVEDVVVGSAQRGKGLGRSLMEVVIAEARKRGISALYLTSRPEREAANALYQKLGFEVVQTNPYRLKL